jgi:hypothetical protein
VSQSIFYHTQESRKNILKNPIRCIRDDAWLGEAFYFWLDLEDAEEWGNKSKRGSNYYEVYQSEIQIDNILDTVFNEDHYFFWFIKELNDYLKERGLWNEIHGIKFQDLPASAERLLIRPIEYKAGKIRHFQYRKRIQLAVYNMEIILNFEFLKREKCI